MLPITKSVLLLVSISTVSTAAAIDPNCGPSSEPCGSICYNVNNAFCNGVLTCELKDSLTNTTDSLMDAGLGIEESFEDLLKQNCHPPLNSCGLNVYDFNLYDEEVSMCVNGWIQYKEDVFQCGDRPFELGCFSYQACKYLGVEVPYCTDINDLCDEADTEANNEALCSADSLTDLYTVSEIEGRSVGTAHVVLRDLCNVICSDGTYTLQTLRPVTSSAWRERGRPASIMIATTAAAIFFAPL